MANNILGTRLKNARVMERLSMDELVVRMKGFVTKQAVSKYERGIMLPSKLVLTELSKILNQKEDYFYKPFTIDVPPIQLRNQTRLAKKTEESILVKVQDELAKFLEIEDIMGLNSEYLAPNLSKVEDFESIVTMVNSLKEQWALGTDGITSVKALLEERCIKVVVMDLPEECDGVSGWAGAIPFIVVNNKSTIEWKRFVLLKEYAHLILEFDESFNKKGIDKYCLLFASELLISSNLFIDILGDTRNKIYLNEVREIQSRFGIPVLIIMEKARALNIISESRFNKFVRSLKHSEDLRKKVNKSLYLCEYSGRFISLIYRALSSGLLTPEKAALLSNKTVEEVKNYTMTIV